MRIYLDNCCFNRPFDDQSQLRIRLETEAKIRIQEDIREGKLKLVWSYILDYENEKNPYEERKIRISSWKRYSVRDISENKRALEIANRLVKKGQKKMDSLHIACAIVAGCDYFITTDDEALKRSDKTNDIKIIDPIGFIKEVS